MSFTKLDHGIIHSSIWFESLATRILWITILALKDENGFVGASRQGLRNAANISEDEFEKGLLCLESPDKDSRSSDYEGRRIEKIDGGWVVLNHEKYRVHEDVRREKARERMRALRANRANNCEQLANKENKCEPSVSVSASASGKEGCGEKTKKRRQPVFVPPSFTDVVQYFAENGYSKELATRFFKGYEVANWHDSKGNPVKSWKQKAINVWFKDENKTGNTTPIKTERTIEDIYGPRLNAPAQSDY